MLSGNSPAPNKTVFYDFLRNAAGRHEQLLLLAEHNNGRGHGAYQHYHSRDIVRDPLYLRELTKRKNVYG